MHHAGELEDLEVLEVEEWFEIVDGKDESVASGTFFVGGFVVW